MPAQPQLVTIGTGNSAVPGLVQATKQGEIFVLDRRTGTPILPATEQPAPQGAAKGDRTAPAQPVSAMRCKAPTCWGATIFDQLACRIAFHSLRYEGRFTPPSTQGTIVYQAISARSTGAAWRSIRCASHRRDPCALCLHRAADPPQGRHHQLCLRRQAGAERELRVALCGKDGRVHLAHRSARSLPSPRWGTIAGVDLRTGKTVWQHKNGTVRDLAPVPLPLNLGVSNIGGPIATAGGVAFLSGTLDYFVRACDVTNGEEIWRDRLPAGGQATPMTYQGGDGRQYLLVVAGGYGSTNTKAGDPIIAYALPK